MARIFLVVGPVGSGKSTYAAQLASEHRALRLNLDEWMAVLFRPDRPEHPGEVVAWYRDRAARSVEQICRVAERALEIESDVVLEIGLIERADRRRFYQRVAGRPLTIYVVDAPRELRRERVERRNREQGATFSMIVPPEIFEMASDLWEPLDETERAGRDVRDVDATGDGLP